MGGGFHLFKVFGININIDWTWVFIFLLVTWSLSFNVFPKFHPEWGLALNLIIGVSSSILFFSSVLVHELAHSLVAKSFGIEVSRIVLFLFGGVSNIQKEPESPRTEFLMAIVGPFTSIILGLIFISLSGINILNLGFALNAPEKIISSLNPVSTLLLWLGPINILVGIFNLIPGFPLDGGRILRSFIWSITGNLKKATFASTFIGQMVAWGFMLLGASMVFGINVPFFGTGVLSGGWLIIIGLFLNNAATQSYERVMIKNMLEGVPVYRLMRKNFSTVSNEININDLLYKNILGTNNRGFPVMENGKFAGFVTLDDVSKEEPNMWGKVKVPEIMTPFNKLEKVSLKENAATALDKLAGKNIAQLPVMENGKLVGLITREDILLWIKLSSEK